jgi:hypothetical protein
MDSRISLLVFPTRAMDVLTAVITAEGEFTMTTPNPEEQALQASPTREPEATKTSNTAPRKPCVAPGKGKSGKKTTPAKKGHQEREGRQSRQEGIWLAEGEQH